MDEMGFIDGGHDVTIDFGRKVAKGGDCNGSCLAIHEALDVIFYTAIIAAYANAGQPKKVVINSRFSPIAFKGD